MSCSVPLPPRPSTRTGMIWHAQLHPATPTRLLWLVVAPIVRDAVEAYHTILHCRQMLAAATQPADVTRWSRLRDQSLRQLNRATDDCNAVGADLLDLSRGLIRFAAMLDDRAVSLLWQLGDAVDNVIKSITQ